METEKRHQGPKKGQKHIKTFYGGFLYGTKHEEDQKISRTKQIEMIEKFLSDVNVPRKSFFEEDTKDMYIVMFLKSYLDTWIENPGIELSTVPTKEEFLSLYPQFINYGTLIYNLKDTLNYKVEKTLCGIKEEILLTKTERKIRKDNLMTQIVTTEKEIEVEEIQRRLQEEDIEMTVKQVYGEIQNHTMKLRKEGYKGSVPKYGHSYKQKNK